MASGTRSWSPEEVQALLSVIQTEDGVVLGVKHFQGMAKILGHDSPVRLVAWFRALQKKENSGHGDVPKRKGGLGNHEEPKRPKRAKTSPGPPNENKDDHLPSKGAAEARSLDLMGPSFLEEAAGTTTSDSNDEALLAKYKACESAFAIAIESDLVFLDRTGSHIWTPVECVADEYSRFRGWAAETGFLTDSEKDGFVPAANLPPTIGRLEPAILTLLGDTLDDIRDLIEQNVQEEPRKTYRAFAS